MAAGKDNVPLAVAVIVATVLALSLGDALIKRTSAEFMLWQIFVLRSLVALPVLFLILRSRRFADVPILPRAAGWTALRSLMLCFMWVAYYASLPNLPLSIAAAAYYTLPLFITLFGALFAGEPVGPQRWLAVCIGFLGVAFILKPTAEGFNAYVLLPLIAAILYALAMILTRTKCRDEHPLLLSAALNIAFIVIGAAATLAFHGNGAEGDFLSGSWTPVGIPEAVAISLLALAILIGSIGTAIAYQLAPSSVVATFDFAYVGFAAIWGVVFFDEMPDKAAWMGMAMIVTAGILALRRREGVGA